MTMTKQEFEKNVFELKLDEYRAWIEARHFRELEGWTESALTEYRLTERNARQQILDAWESK